MKNKDIHFFVDEQFHKQLKQLAKKHSRTISGLLRWLVIKEIDNNERK